jgi:hypothetical protein
MFIYFTLDDVLLLMCCNVTNGSQKIIYYYGNPIFTEDFLLSIRLFL